MTAGFATLTLESYCDTELRRSAPSTSRDGLREFLIGPENALIQQSIGLSDATNAKPTRVDFDCIPLLICAPSGYGKSHLLQALAATWSRDHGVNHVIYTTAADFVNSFAHALKIDDVPQFQQRFRRADLLLIDDLDSIKDRVPSQEQLATILDHRLRFERPTVFATRQPLHALRLTARLSSRISAGLSVPMQLPSSATRQELLSRICRHRQMDLTDEAAQLLANQSQLSVPQLTGIINQLAVAGNRNVSQSEMEQLLASSDSDQADPKAIIRATARHFALPIANLTGTSRRKMDVLARFVAIRLIRELTTLSFQQIGQLFNGRDHTTVMHAYKKTLREDVDSTTRNAIRELRRILMPQGVPLQAQSGKLPARLDNEP